MLSRTRPWLALVVPLGLGLGVAGCGEGKEGPAESLGRELDEAVHEVKESVEESFDRDGPAERAGERIDDAVEGDRPADGFDREDADRYGHETVDTSARERERIEDEKVRRDAERLEEGLERDGPIERAGEALDGVGGAIKDAVDTDGPAERAGERLDGGDPSRGDALDRDGAHERAGQRLDDLDERD